MWINKIENEIGWYSYCELIHIHIDDKDGKRWLFMLLMHKLRFTLKDTVFFPVSCHNLLIHIIFFQWFYDSLGEFGTAPWIWHKFVPKYLASDQEIQTVSPPRMELWWLMLKFVFGILETKWKRYQKFVHALMLCFLLGPLFQLQIKICLKSSIPALCIPAPCQVPWEHAVW